MELMQKNAAYALSQHRLSPASNKKIDGSKCAGIAHARKQATRLLA